MPRPAHAIEADLDRAASAADRAYQLAREEEPDTYRDFTISYDPPPIPAREFDWCATHKDYDPTPEHSFDPPRDGSRVLHAASREALIEEIDDWYDERSEPGEILGEVTAENDPEFHAALTRYVMFGRQP